MTLNYFISLQIYFFICNRMKKNVEFTKWHNQKPPTIWFLSADNRCDGTSSSD